MNARDTTTRGLAHDGQNGRRDGQTDVRETDMSEVLTVDAILFGLLVFSGIIGNILVIYVVRERGIKQTIRSIRNSR